MTSLRNINL